MFYIGIIIMLTFLDSFLLSIDYLAQDNDLHPRRRHHNPGMDWYISHPSHSLDNRTTHNNFVLSRVWYKDRRKGLIQVNGLTTRSRSRL